MYVCQGGTLNDHATHILDNQVVIIIIINFC
jgi:hypothetical protein